MKLRIASFAIQARHFESHQLVHAPAAQPGYQLGPGSDTQDTAVRRERSIYTLPRLILEGLMLAVCALALVSCSGGGGDSTGGTKSGNSVIVPNVVSDTVAQATTALQGANLTLGAQTTASSSTVPTGEIISQDPAAGTSAASGSAVAVVVSSGVATVSVPNVVSDTVAQATTALEAVGLTLGNQTTASSSTVPTGEIISQNPAAGANVASGSAVSVVVSSGAAPPPTETVLYSFGNSGDGQNPQASLIQASDGNFYGTTDAGGATGEGTVFEITPAGVETVLHSFGNSGDGDHPQAGLIQGSDGNFYGTTYDGGANDDGTVFKITPAGMETVLYSFGSSGDGYTPAGGLIQGSDGNFYGTTSSGGAHSFGTVFKITPGGAETVLYSFGANGDGDADEPFAGLIQGSDGNFYGTTALGGLTSAGTVFKITPAGAETVLYSFANGKANDGQHPRGLIQGSDGNFYGTTNAGGANSRGTVFEITPSGTETVLHSFGSGSDGQNPDTGVIQGSDGNFYGTTQNGGANGDGTVFQVTAAGLETVLYSFGSSGDGRGPQAGVIQGSDGNFYGTTYSGGANSYGTVFKIVP